MTAPQLLDALKARGAAAHLEKDSDGAAVLVVVPGSAVADLLPDLQRFKPALLELLTASESSCAPAAPEAPATEPATASPFREVTPRLLVPANIETAPGAAAICSTLQTFGKSEIISDLPKDALEIEIAGESHHVENAAACVLALESEWTRHARRCQSERRDLTTPEAAALDAAAELLNHVWACYDGPGEMWLDLAALNSQLDGDLAAMHRKQRAAKVAAQSEATP